MQRKRERERESRSTVSMVIERLRVEGRVLGRTQFAGAVISIRRRVRGLIGSIEVGLMEGVGWI